jgi:hypothetical protein
VQAPGRVARRPRGPSCWRRRMKRRRRRTGNWPRNWPTFWKYSRLSPRPMTWAGRMSCRKRAASAPSAAASTTGSSSNTSTKLGNITPAPFGSDVSWQSAERVSPGGCSANHCAIPGMCCSKVPGAETLSTPARSVPRFSKSWVTLPGTTTNDPVLASIHSVPTSTLIVPART